jgi:1,5-anhydro-D-fructose reductase (1,5-anhydro-D-mannitol-forming)
MTLRIGIIGPGLIADQKLAPALRRVPGACLWSVLSRDQERATAFAARHHAAAPAPAFSEIDAFLADPRLDAVIIATPDRLHARETTLAAAAGKHVLVEKPMATSVEEARAMVEACRAAGVRLGVAYHLRFHAGHLRLVEQIKAGVLGDIRHFRAQMTFRAAGAGNWRASSEVGQWWAMAAVGTHCIDLARFFLMPSAGEVVEIRSLCSRAVYRGPHDETAIVAMRFASGATAEITVSVLFESTPMVEIYGSAGSAICEGTLGPHGAGRMRVRGAEISFPFDDPYAGEIADFVESVTTGREPAVSGEQGLWNVEILTKAAAAS